MVLRIAGPADLPALGEFLLPLGGPTFPQRFPGQLPHDFYRWKYFENPAGDALVGVAMSEGSPVSTVAAVPKRFQAGAAVVTAYELGDFLTVESCRRRGLFSRLVEQVCSEASRRGGALAYVRPNENSFPLLVPKLGFGEPFRIRPRRFVAIGRALAHRLRLPAALARRSGLDRVGLDVPGPTTRGLEVESARRFGPEADELWERVRRGYPMAVVRDSRYLNWRYVDTPTPYRVWNVRRAGILAGFLVALPSPAESTAYVLEVFADRDDRGAAAFLVRSCFRELLAGGARSVYTWTTSDPSGSAPDACLRQACRSAAGPPLHFAVRWLGDRTGAPGRWAGNLHLSLGDFDGT